MNDKPDFLSRRPALRTAVTLGHSGPPDSGSPMSVPNSVMAFVEGIDPVPRVIDRLELESFGDAFSQRMLLTGTPPLTVRELLDSMSSLPTGQALPVREMFLVAEGARKSLVNPDFRPNARLVYTWGKGGFGNSNAEILVSTVPVLDNPAALLQVMAWSEADSSFHFFEREGGRWTWMGHSPHALDARSRGRGPFMGHRNGGPVMKELLFPWVHWNSTTDSLPLETLANTDLGKHPAMSTVVSNAQTLEDIVRSGLVRWTNARIAADRAANEIRKPLHYGRQIVTTSSINLFSSDTVLMLDEDKPVQLPEQFFFDRPALKTVAAQLGLDQTVLDSQTFLAERDHYKQAATELGLHVLGSPIGPRVDGDTHFAFVVPARAQEDQVVLEAILKVGWLSPHLALSMLMVDFSNPVFSPKRAALAHLFQDTPVPIDGDVPLDGPIIDAARNGSSAGHPAVVEMLRNLETDPQHLLDSRISIFGAGVKTALSTSDGVAEILRLASSRRMSFQQGMLRELAEFEATMAQLDAPVRPRRMRENGTIEEIVAA